MDYLKYQEQIKQLCLFDDEFMTQVFDDNIECTQLILSIILDRDDLIVTQVKAQSDKGSLPGHELRIDIDAIDNDGNLYDIEVQQKNDGAIPKRARYHSSVMDVNGLPKNTNFDKLPECYVIFITENDILGAGLPVYNIERTIKQLDKPFGDGSHIVYVNGAYKGDDKIGRLMSDFRNKETEGIFYKQLADSIKYYKESEKGAEIMSSVFEKVRAEGKAEGKAEGRAEGKEL